MLNQLLTPCARALFLVVTLLCFLPFVTLCFLLAFCVSAVGGALRAWARQLHARAAPSMRRSDAFTTACLLALFAFCSGCQTESSSKAPPLATVRYMQVTARPVTLTRALPGRIAAFKVAEVRPQVGGIVQARLFEEGSNVAAGQPLYQIDPVVYQAAYNTAKANLERAAANEEAARLLAERYTRLVKTNSVSRQERDDAIAAYNQVKAEIEACRETLESAAINLGYTTVAAPVGGRIGRSAVTEGALVTQNQADPMATIQLISPVYVDITQSSAQLLKLRRALASGALTSGGPASAKVRLFLEDGSAYMRGDEQNPDGEWIEGELLFSDITVQESTGTVLLRAKFDNPDGILLPGMFVRATLVEGVLEKAILAPQKSVTRDARNLPQVLVLTPANGEHAQNGAIYTVEARSVSIDREYENAWLLASGLEPGELLVIDGVHKVRPGQSVSGTLVATEDALAPASADAPPAPAAR